MATSRLKNEDIISRIENKNFYASPLYLSKLRNAINNGEILIDETIILREQQRLDTLAGKKYGDGRYWWVLAIASGIGYSLQVPPGTIITIPNINDVLRIL